MGLPDGTGDGDAVMRKCSRAAGVCIIAAVSLYSIAICLVFTKPSGCQSTAFHILYVEVVTASFHDYVLAEENGVPVICH